MLRIRPDVHLIFEYPFQQGKDKIIGCLQMHNTLDEELGWDEDFLYGIIEECWRDYGWDGHLYNFEVEVWITFEVY